MKTRIFIVLSAAALLASCQKEVAVETVQQPEIKKTVLTVGIAPQTKTQMQSSLVNEKEHEVFWSPGDQIRVNRVASDALESGFVPAKTARFTIPSTNIVAPYNVVYPASIATDTDDEHVTLPAVQTYKDGGFADGMFPMAGCSTDGSGITLSYLCSIVKISVKRATTGTVDEDNIACVRFKGRNSEKVSGEFAIDYSSPKLTEATGTGADLEVRVVQNKSTSSVAVYYIVVPAREYANGFDVIVQDVNGHIMTMRKTASWTAVPGKLYNMPEFDFVPTATELGVEISSAAEFVQFAKDYNEKKFSGYGSSLIVNLTDNISFEDNADANVAGSYGAFNATGGIGLKEDFGDSEDYYFRGLFNGNGKTISGLKGTVSIFKATEQDATIKDLIVDNSCSFTFARPVAEKEAMLGSVVGYHKGVLDNVKSAADVSLAEATGVAQMTTLGGLVGRATIGKLQNGCEYSGLISTPAGFTTTGKLIIGGLVGRFSNIGSINGCNFKGAINNAAQVTSTDKANPYLIIGGIAGHVNGSDEGKVASITSCATTADHEAVASAHASLSAIIVNKTTVAYHSAVGGIVGELGNGVVSSCTNAATIGNSIFRGSDASGRYIKSGGIVGRNAAEGVITGCTNNGTITHRSNPRIQTLGGIAGYNAGRITACTNNAQVRHDTSGQSIAAGRSVNLGGVIGENYADNMVFDVHNTANIEIASMEDALSANGDPVSEERLGGVIGYNEGIIVGGASKDITNSGQVYHSPKFTNQFIGYYLGGIVGYTKAAIKNAKNIGRPYFRWQGNTPDLGASNVHLGGIVGKAAGAESTIENCDNVVDAGVTNSAQVYLYLPGSAGHNTNYVGGIVGLTEATNPIKNCINGGEVRTAAGASTVPVTGIMMGGIIGKMTGSGEVNNADNSGRVRINFIAAEDGHSGNFLGGIIGYIVSEASVTVTGCDNSGNVDISNNKSPVQDLIVSGVVGRMDAAGTISNCNNNGGAINLAITAAAVTMKDLYIAGILGKSEQNVTISGCTNTGAVSGGNSSSAAGNSLYMGGIAAYMKGASKIQDCSNTGTTASTHSGNNDTIGNTALTAGIAGYVEGTDANPFEIGGTTGCTVNTSAALSATRGWIGGVAAYAKYAQISNCTVESVIGGGCAARGAGGIVGKAENCSISSSSYKGDQIKANQIQASTGEGGIVGNLDNSTIDGCSCFATKFYNNNSQPFGCIVGISNSNNTIQNCHYKASVEGPTSGTAATAQVAGSGTFNGSGNAADLQL